MGEANPFFQIGASKRRPLGCLLLSEGDLLFPPPMNPTSQPLGKADLEDLFSGFVSTELGPSLEPQTHRGRKTTWTSLCSLGEL